MAEESPETGWPGLFRRLDVVYSAACMLQGQDSTDPMLRALVLRRISADLVVLAARARELEREAREELAGQVGVRPAELVRADTELPRRVSAGEGVPAAGSQKQERGLDWWETDSKKG
jgi:hypothetical protein